jgi:Beta-propeller repeat
VDGAGAAYVTGLTGSTETTFPDAIGPDTSFNGGFFDGFVAKVAPTGTSLEYAGYIGGAGTNEFGSGIAVDGAGAAYVTGTTESSEATFPDGDGFGSLTGPDTSYNGSGDAFVAKVASSGASLDYAGYVGGSGDGDVGFGIAVDGAGAAYLTGSTDSTEASFPDGDGFGTLPGPDTSYNGGLSDAFVAKVDSSGTSLAYAGYIGGSGIDIGQGISVDGVGAAYLTGYTDSDQTSFPDGDGFGTVMGPDSSYNGGTDAFVAKVADVVPPSPPPQATCKGTAATVVGTPGADALSGTNGADVIAGLGGNDTEIPPGEGSGVRGQRQRQGQRWRRQGQGERGDGEGHPQGSRGERQAERRPEQGHVRGSAREGQGSGL